jgi:hypothetical protein
MQRIDLSLYMKGTRYISVKEIPNNRSCCHEERMKNEEYRLTLRAKELRVIFEELGTWASRWKVPMITTKTKSRAGVRSAG